MKKRLTVILAVIGLLATSGVALAQEETEQDGDTVFNFGYDTENGVFVWGISSTDGELDCSLEPFAGETLNATYVVEDGVVHVEGLTSDATGPVQFPPTDDTSGGDPVDYADAEECALSGGEVAGPQGQVNHGMFMKFFNSQFDGRTRGCVVRHLAQSDLGKGDQQVNVPDVEEDDEETTLEEGTITFESVVTTCLQERDEELEGEGNGNGGGKPEGVGNGKPAWAGQGKPPWAGGPGGPPGGDDD